MKPVTAREGWRPVRAAAWAAGCALALGLAACEREWDHTPPDGQGSVIVDNRTADELDVYLDGRATNRVDDFDYEVFDHAPGVVRVVLDEAHGRRAWGGDVDVIEGKRTVLEVSDRGRSSYDVRVALD